MKAILIFLVVAAICSTPFSALASGLFKKKTPHERYAKQLEKDGLAETPLGRQWMEVSETALEHPHSISLPYRQTGYFQTDKPRSLGLKFSAKRGQRITFSVEKKTGANFVLYTDLFKVDGNDTEHIQSPDTLENTFYIDVEETGHYLLRLQPELYRTGTYDLSVSVGPSVGFPVSGTARVLSFWGAVRDGGKRKHEGIDIFAKKLTPVVAATDGIITGVHNGGIGGKTVWLRSLDGNLTFYYAHLHKQLVHTGQVVKKGKVLGLVGNTGNAKYTPAHLHFGIYTGRGAIDPFPFVNRKIEKAPAAPEKKLNHHLKLAKTQQFNKGKIIAKANTILVPVAVNAKGYLCEMPDGKIVQAGFASVTAP
jgi:murein DD-endopeptidase MepM/ murein hydrolase activator NlpD